MTQVHKLQHLQAFRKVENTLTGCKVFDELNGGLVEGGISEFYGYDGGGKKSLVIAILAGLSRNNKTCCIVDTSNSFDPVSAEKSGVNLDKLLWAKCNNDPQKAIIATDYIIKSGSFDAIWIDLSQIEESFLQRLPSSYWFRFKSTIRETHSSLLVTLRNSMLKSATHQSLKISRQKLFWQGDLNFKLAIKSRVNIELQKPIKKKCQIDFFNDYQNA